MNQPQAQGSCLSKNPVSGPTPASSQLPNTFLSSSESQTTSVITPPGRHNQNFQEMNIITHNFLQSCGHSIPFNSIDDLFNHGFLSNLRDQNGKTLLMVAAERGSLELMQKCFDHNIPVDVRDKSGKSALSYAVEAEASNTRPVSLLLGRGADPNIRCKNGVTPLLKAVEKARFKIAEILLKSGSYSYAKYESTGDTALHLAARKGDRKIVKLLLENGCDPKRKNKKKQSVWDVCKENHDIIEIIKTHQHNKEECLPNIRRVNSEAIYHSQPLKGPVLQEIEGDKSDANEIAQQYGEGLQSMMGGPCNSIISNLPEPPSLVLSHANRNDDNFSNASTNYSNAHSEYRFNIKHNSQTANQTNNTNDEANRYPDRSVQQSNPKSFHNRKREDSGVSRTSLTSVHSDMASDNESMSGHSQNNVPSDYSSIYFSPELHEKTRSTGSIGSTEPVNVNGYMTNTLTKNNSYPYPFAQNNGEYNGNTYQKRKYPKNNYQQGMKNPYHSQNSFESHSSHSYRREDSGYNSQGEIMNHNYPYNNNFNQQKRDQHEYMLQHQRTYPLPHDSQLNYQNYQHNMAGPNGQPNFIPNGPMNPNMMMQQPLNGGFMPMDMTNSPNLNMTRHNQYYYKAQQFQYQQAQMPQDPLTKMFNNMHNGHNGHNQLASPPTNHGVPQGHYYNQQTPPRRTISENNHQLQNESSRQKEYIRSFVMDAKEGQKELEIEKNENTELKEQIEAVALTTKGLEEELKEKDDILQTLMKKTEELERIIKEKDPNFVYKSGQSQSFSTNPLLDDFRPMTIEEALAKPYPRHKAIDEVIPVLHEEILSFERTITSYYTGNNDVLDTLLDLVRDSLMQIAPDAKCSIYGSFATKLCLPDSDIDLVVELPQLEFAFEVLARFEAHILGSEWVGHVKTIQNRTVPLLKITCSDAYLNKKIDITIQDPRHNGLSCVELVKEYIKTYPALKPMSLVLKHFLMILDLNDTYSGGLSSYGLLLMIVHFFQTKEQHRSTLPMEDQNLGELLLSFLYFYGFEHDYYTHLAVYPKKLQKNGELETDSTSNANLLTMIQQQQASIVQPRIIIQDPISLKNNIGRSTFRIREIKNAFMAAYFEAFKPCTCEVHEYIQRIDYTGEEKEIQCTNILRKMFLAYRPEQ